MPAKFMILPSRDAQRIRLLSVPDDFEEHEIYRVATGIIAAVESKADTHQWTDVLEALEEHGFSEVDFTLGPEI